MGKGQCSVNEQYKFWMVWSPQGRAPSVKHALYVTATKEAERLASLYPAQEFFVLEAMRLCKHVTVHTIDLQEEPLPF